MRDDGFLPPGHHPDDQALGREPPVDWQLRMLRSKLRWASEHYGSFTQLRGSDPERAEDELTYLGDVLGGAMTHLNRLEDLLRHGYPASPTAPARRRDDVPQTNPPRESS